MKAAGLRVGRWKVIEVPDLSNTDALLVAVPMIGILIVGFFRLDELVGKPRKHNAALHQSLGRDAHDQPVCIDPDGTLQPVRPSKRTGR